MQLLIFLLVYQQIDFLAHASLVPSGTLVGSNGLLGIWLLRNQVALSFFAHSFLAELWWAQMDSDHRPHAYQACALTS